MLDFVLNFLFPPVCVICGKVNKNWICSKCENILKKYYKFELINMNNFNFQIRDKQRNLKFDEKIYFDEIFYCFEYKKTIRKLLLQYKFNDKSYLANFWAKVIMNNKKISEIFKNYDIIIPVPMDRNKRLERGYNQTELITDIISKERNILSDNKILLKARKTRNTKFINL